MLTLPDDGLIVPTKAISRISAVVVETAKAMPDAVISAAAQISSRRWSMRAPRTPMPSVIKAEPSKASVASRPISKAPMPIIVR